VRHVLTVCNEYNDQACNQQRCDAVVVAEPAKDDVQNLEGDDN